jgi:hypothetical protein
MSLEFSNTIWTWRGPAPFHFVTVPKAECEMIKDISKLVTYGWGMIPVTVQIGNTTWTTSLWPKDGAYIMPIKDKVRKAEKLSEGDTVTVKLEVGISKRRNL